MVPIHVLEKEGDYPLEGWGMHASATQLGGNGDTKG